MISTTRKVNKPPVLVYSYRNRAGRGTLIQFNSIQIYCTNTPILAVYTQHQIHVNIQHKIQLIHIMYNKIQT
jgi:hypothetical protein